ncbi:uncharacterized protein LOC100204688 [Hydra vulgaris]|uniref:Uncharacterized protein LOC100204688 n=1 Tax=Hydra vulgaris TaxID=6087 RepID=A0ABM4DN66_HYDVU
MDTKLKRNKQFKSICFTHNFEKNICRDVFVVALNELLKHILFIRYQIPQPLISIQKEILDEEKLSESRDKISRNPNYKRWLQKSCFVKGFLEITSSLTKVIRSEINKVVFIFGSTVISPKEAIVIHIDDVVFDDAEKENIPMEDTATLVSATCRRLLQDVVTSDQFHNLKELNYRLPSRGVVHNIYLKSSMTEKINLPLDTVQNISDKKVSTSESIEIDLRNVFNDLAIRERFEGYWYQANISLRGFKDKSLSNGTDWI